MEAMVLAGASEAARAGAAALARLGEVFAGESLRPPFVPEALTAAFSQRETAVFGTRDPQEGLYAFGHYVSELGQAELEDYLLLGFDGHGMASHALHYYLVCGPLAVFIQLNHANPFVDEAIGRRRIDGTLGLVERLFDALMRAERADRLPAGKRLVVVDSDFTSGGWGWVSAGEAPSLTTGGDALLGGLLAVKSLFGSAGAAAPVGVA